MSVDVMFLYRVNLDHTPVDIFQVVIIVEVLCHGRCVAQTLQDGIHVASVAKITKASQTRTQASKRWIQIADFGC